MSKNASQGGTRVNKMLRNTGLPPTYSSGSDDGQDNRLQQPLHSQRKSKKAQTFSKEVKYAECSMCLWKYKEKNVENTECLAI